MRQTRAREPLDATCAACGAIFGALFDALFDALLDAVSAPSKLDDARAFSASNDSCDTLIASP
ncbi:hypothetical protein [Paraburkholderia tropica]|uniref:hypothetical protein n=1 Tax=Paraburkholderia tropica TaxID=92647 RepID=UPI0016162A96|nr:hypothetical protein [Paraburkholderia tropica]MBB2978215.1 hypothetical protein [Paraburkholderia tropica]